MTKVKIIQGEYAGQTGVLTGETQTILSEVVLHNNVKCMLTNSEFEVIKEAQAEETAEETAQDETEVWQPK